MKSTLDLVGRVEALIAVICFSLATAAVVLDVILREVFATSGGELLKLGLYLLITAGVLGLGLATAQNRHLRPRFTDTWLPAALQPRAQSIGDALSFLVFAAMGVLSLVLISTSLEFDFRIAGTHWPLWIPQSVMAYGFFSTALRHAIFALDPSLRPTEETKE